MSWLKGKQAEFNGLLIIFIVLFVLIPTAVFAIEGTCSWHGGVNCSAMADWDGSAICNDGWRDSSETYSSVQECKLNRHYCTQSEYDQINLKYDTAGKANKANDLGDQLQALNSQLNALQIEALQIPLQMQQDAVGRGITSGGLAPLISSALRENQIKQDTVNIQITTAKSALREALGNYWNSRNEADRECYALGDAAYFKLQADYYKQLQSLQTQTQSTSQTSCPANSERKESNICTCNSGYSVYRGECIKSDDYCKITYGNNSFAAVKNGVSSCQCVAGYTWNSSVTSCIKIETQTIPQPTPVPIKTQKTESDFTRNILPSIKQASSTLKKQNKAGDITAASTTLLASTTTQVSASQSHEDSPKEKPKTFLLKVVQPFNSVVNFFRKFKFW